MEALDSASTQQQSHSLQKGDDCGNYMALGSFGDSDSQNGLLSEELKARRELGRISLSSPSLGGYLFNSKGQWTFALPSVVGQQSLDGGVLAL